MSQEPDLLSPSMSANYKRRRGSSVGKINLGDTSPALATMYRSKAQRSKSSDRIMELSRESKSDLAILRKMYVGFIELTYRHTWIVPFIILSVFFSAFF